MKLLVAIYFSVTILLGSLSLAASHTADEETPTSKNKESDIVVNLDGPKKTATNESSLQKMLLMAIVFSAAGVGIVVYIKKNTTKNSSRAQTTQIKVLSQHHLGPKRSLALVRVAGESILVGITDNSINLIKSLSLLDDEVPEDVAATPFKKVMGDMDPAPTMIAKNQNQTEAEEFSISGIKDLVSKRLKNMRSIE